MKKVFVQNIVSPYRSNFFNSVFQKDQSFAVYYMGKTENDRNWDINTIIISHDHWIDKWGLYFTLFGYHIHFNPILIVKLLFNRGVSDVILAVGYADINILMLITLKHLRLTKKKFHFWAEANYLTNGARNENYIKKQLRKYVFSAVDGYLIVPGKMSIITFDIWGIHNKNYLIIPNSIDEANLNYNPEKEQKQSLPIFLMPVRLIEKVKGIKNFFEAIGTDNIKKARFLIAGDGQDRKLYEDFVIENNLQTNIELLGFCDSKKMNYLYNHVDGVILPSFSDPSPLSLVEALRFHLPILCSSHCGNHFETVEDGVSGFVFSPLDKGEIRNTFEAFYSRKEHWKSMGEHGYKLFEDSLNTKVITDRLVNSFN